jgi:heme/copper-type cytochrome/quinol oxidase subunit 2
MQPKQPEKTGGRHQTGALWAGLALGPVAWAVHLQLVYAASQQACQGDLAFVALHVMSAACLATAIVGGLLSFSLWRHERFTAPSQYDEGSTARRRFMSVEGVMSGTLFSIVIVAQWVALFYLSPCAASF